MKLYLTILLCLCLTFCFGQKITFNAVGFELKPEDSAKIHRMASYEAKIFNGLYNNLINDSLNITLNLYSSRKVFKTLVAQNGIKGFTESGFYLPASDQSFVYYEGIGNLNTVLHELSHAFLKNNSKYYPKWLNEGLAEFLETLEEKTFNIRIVSQWGRLEQMKNFQREKKLNLQAFLNDYTGWRDKKKLDYMYTVSYSLIYYLYKKDPQLISKMTQLYRKGYGHEYIFKLLGGMDNLQNGFNIYFR
jgi:hypothetical protein